MPFDLGSFKEASRISFRGFLKASEEGFGEHHFQCHVYHQWPSGHLINGLCCVALCSAASESASNTPEIRRFLTRDTWNVHV